MTKKGTEDAFLLEAEVPLVTGSRPPLRMLVFHRYPLSLSEESPPSPASVRSYQSSRRSRDLSDWQAEDVGHFLHRLGLDNYVDVFESAGIDGQTLMFLDHESLKDLGLAQVGLRLRILKAVYEVKIRDGIALDDEDWLPAGVQPCTGCNERIGRLENEYDALRNEVEGLRVVVNAILPRKNESHHSQNTYLNGRRPTLTVNTKRQQNRNASRPASLTPTASAPRGGLDLSAIPMSGMPTGVVMPMTTATPQDETGRRDYFDGSQTDSPAPLSPYEQPRTADKHPQTPLTKRLDEVGESASPKNGNKDGPPTPRKAPHDTCLQVLPAAVKKYNLKHPWFQYTMIVTTPNGQKRALAYDERPRQIVHDLRSQGEKPSCLVQHQSELRSPLALSASRKAKLFRRYIDGSDNPSISIPSQILPTLEAGRSLSDDMRERLPPFARFAFAIYSWMAEGDGETDAIEYGDCFMVSDKRDGMLEVQRVSEGETGSSHLKIPSSVALQMFTLPTSRPGQPKVIDVNMIAGQYSSSTVLIDRQTTVNGELELMKGDKVRIYARASHWCFCIRASTLTAGWVPQWILSTSQAQTRRQEPLSPAKK